MKQSKLIHWFIITTFISLYVVVSVISTIHVIDFFSLSNPYWLAISLAIAFEIGAAASLASIITLDKMNKALVWALFIILTCMQMMGNAYFAFSHVHDYQSWVELFGLVDEDPLYQKRVLSIISGAILPLVALGFIKSLVDYLRPTNLVETAIPSDIITSAHSQPDDVLVSIDKLPPIKEESPKIDILNTDPVEKSADATNERLLNDRTEYRRRPGTKKKTNPQLMPGLNS